MHTNEKKTTPHGLVAGAQRKIHHDLIRRHWRKIQDCEAVLVINHEKKGVKNYIGGNTFLEMGFAFVLEKKIFLLNDIPEILLIKQEIEAMQPSILHGDLDNIDKAFARIS